MDGTLGYPRIFPCAHCALDRPLRAFQHLDTFEIVRQEARLHVRGQEDAIDMNRRRARRQRLVVIHRAHAVCEPLEIAA